MIKLIASVMLSVIANLAMAQKLPNVQTMSLRAPGDIKIDGKAQEWGGQFKAHNSATNLYYTLSNDDDNLYLAIQARDPDYVTKCIRQGFILTIKPPEGQAVSFAYPDTRAVRVAMTSNIYKKLNAGDKQQADSMVNALNQQITVQLSKLKITGVRTLADSILSVNNNDKIHVAASFDNNRYYTCELSIPLKYLNLPAGSAVPFTYSIKMIGQLEGRKNNEVFIVESNFMKALNYTTDFSAKYTLSQSAK